MCGILAILCADSAYPPRGWIDSAMDALHRRGPDQRGVLYCANAVMCHTRLAIVNPETGAQPIVTSEWILSANGEIYNSGYQKGVGTDCDSILRALRDETLADLNGQFAFAAYNKRTGEMVVGRDRAGIAPLYVGHDSAGRVWISSLIAAFPPGAVISAPSPGTLTYYRSGLKRCIINFVKPYPVIATNIPFHFELKDLRDCIIEAVRIRLPTQVPYAFLLSGGLDSTIIACVARMLYPDMPMHTFCIGLKDGPDISAALEVADHIHSNHTTINYTVKEGIDALSDVVQCIETYDQTTVRASTPMFLLLRVIRRYGYKVVMSGEGADEVFAGYLYNHLCPSPDDLQQECADKLERLYHFDCLRANKCCLGNSVEARVPFLDNNVVDFAMRFVHPVHKMGRSHVDGPRIEKHILREAFKDILPKSIYERTKAQFSDAVGSRWIKSLQKHAQRVMGIADPSVAEKELYKALHDMHYHDRVTADAISVEDKSIACSTSRALQWHAKFKDYADPSGDAVALAVKDDGSDDVKDDGSDDA